MGCWKRLPADVCRVTKLTLVDADQRRACMSSQSMLYGLLTATVAAHIGGHWAVLRPWSFILITDKLEQADQLD